METRQESGQAEAGKRLGEMGSGHVGKVTEEGLQSYEDEERRHNWARDTLGPGFSEEVLVAPQPQLSPWANVCRVQGGVEFGALGIEVLEAE